MAQQTCTVEAVVDILHTKVGVPREKLTDEGAAWEDVGVDSLGITETVLALEQEFAITIPDQQAFQTHNIGELVSLVNTIQTGSVQV